MKKSRYNESQIINILKMVEAGRLVKDVCREFGISDATYYNWKAKYGGMEASDIKRMKDLEEENRRLKQMYANLSLEHTILKDIIEKKALKPAEKRELIDYVVVSHQTSVRIACKVVGLSRSSYNYEPDTRRDQVVIEVLQRLAKDYPAYGFQMMFDKLRQEGFIWNHKRVYRIYRSLNLNLRRKGKKRLPSRNPERLAVPETLNQTWSADFMSDSLMTGRRFRTFNVVDDFNRELLGIAIDLNIPSMRVIRELDQIAHIRGYPKKLRLDNGPEFISGAMAEWAKQHAVELEFIQPGKPTQNSYIERFNRTYRTEVLNMYAFRNLTEVKEITEAWIKEYNEERPHQALNSMSPVQYRLSKHPETSNLAWH